MPMQRLNRVHQRGNQHGTDDDRRAVLQESKECDQSGNNEKSRVFNVDVAGAKDGAIDGVFLFPERRATQPAETTFLRPSRTLLSASDVLPLSPLIASVRAYLPNRLEKIHLA